MVLVHCCCADCTLKLLNSLEKENTLNSSEISLYFLNPNIHPESEYLARLKAFQSVFYGKAYKLVVPNYKPREYFQVVSKIDRTNKLSRCPQCWRLRLAQSFEYANAHGYDSVTSTLLSSSYQDQTTMTKIAQSIAKKLSLKLIIPQKIDHELHTCGFYKQNYCGCIYSLMERLEEKHFKLA